jgi:D-alanyl-D-alanine carboxypeptidase (penicillin-binding protein 5/6)
VTFAHAKKETETEESSQAVDITAKAAVLIENSSGRILYQKEKDTELVPASITKIMTLLLIFEALENNTIHLEDMVTVSDYAASMGGSQVFLESGETQSVDTMIKCISVASANDAAVAMAEWIAGSESAFVEKMNEKAKSLGMKHTNFLNCNGLDDDITKGHYSSAYDVALMSQALITQYPQISDYSTIWMDEITHSTKKGETQFGLTNTNKLIRTYQGITGLKTGSTSKAKYCLSATASRAGVSLTAVVMAAPDPKTRFSEAASLLDYGFANCTGYYDETTKLSLEPIPVAGGKSETVQPLAAKDFSYTLCKGETAEQIKRSTEYKKNLTAPIQSGDVIGRVVYSLEDQVIEEIPLLAGEDVGKATFSHCYQKLLKKIMMS